VTHSETGRKCVTPADPAGSAALSDREFTQGFEVQKRSKYGAKKTVVDGITFDSMAEAARYGALKIVQAAGLISELRLQVRYDITVNGRKVCRYVADFVYIENGKEVVEDVKGMKTPVYNLKKKLMEAVFGVVILETGLRKKKGKNR
jgi:hypothetical protein